jgi:hypothetical protein
VVLAGLAKLVVMVAPVVAHELRAGLVVLERQGRVTLAVALTLTTTVGVVGLALLVLRLMLATDRPTV